MHRVKHILETLSARIEELQDAIKEHGKAIRSAQESEGQEEPRPKKIYADISNDEESVRDEKAESERQYRVQNSIRWATWCAFVAACAFAAISIGQWHELHIATQAATESAIAATKAAKAASDQLAQMQSDAADTAKRNDAATEQGIEIYRTEQRAWIAITATGYTLALNKPLTVSIRIQNLGKTPARHFDGHIIVELLFGGKMPKFTYHKHRPGKPIRIGGGINIPVCLPNFQADAEATWGTALPHGQTAFPVLTQEFANQIGSGQARLFAHGMGNYDDLFGVHHWIRFCFVLEPGMGTNNASMKNCDQNNEIDDNPEYSPSKRIGGQ